MASKKHGAPAGGVAAPPLRFPVGTELQFNYNLGDRVQTFAGQVVASKSADPALSFRLRVPGPPAKEGGFESGKVHWVTVVQPNRPAVKVGDRVEQQTIWGDVLRCKVTEVHPDCLVVAHDSAPNPGPLINPNHVIWGPPARIKAAKWATGGQTPEALPLDYSLPEKHKVELHIVTEGVPDGTPVAVQVFQKRKGGDVPVFRKPGEAASADQNPLPELPSSLRGLIVRGGAVGKPPRGGASALAKPWVQFPSSPTLYKSPWYYFTVKAGSASGDSGKEAKTLLYLRYPITALLNPDGSLNFDGEKATLRDAFVLAKPSLEDTGDVGARASKFRSRVTLFNEGRHEMGVADAAPRCPTDATSFLRFIQGRFAHVHSAHGTRFCGEKNEPIPSNFVKVRAHFSGEIPRAKTKLANDKICARIDQENRGEATLYIEFRGKSGGVTRELDVVTVPPGQRQVIISLPAGVRWTDPDVEFALKPRRNPDGGELESEYRVLDDSWYSPTLKRNTPQKQTAFYCTANDLLQKKHVSGMPKDWRPPYAFLMIGTCEAGATRDLIEAFHRDGKGTRFVVAFATVIWSDEADLYLKNVLDAWKGEKLDPEKLGEAHTAALRAAPNLLRMRPVTAPKIGGRVTPPRWLRKPPRVLEDVRKLVARQEKTRRDFWKKHPRGVAAPPPSGGAPPPRPLPPPLPAGPAPKAPSARGGRGGPAPGSEGAKVDKNARADADKKAKADRRAKAKADRRAKAKADRRAKAKAEKKAKAAAEKKRKAEAKAKAKAKKKEKADKKAKAGPKAKPAGKKKKKKRKW